MILECSRNEILAIFWTDWIPIHPCDRHDPASWLSLHMPFFACIRLLSKDLLPPLICSLRILPESAGVQALRPSQLAPITIRQILCIYLAYIALYLLASLVHHLRA